MKDGSEGKTIIIGDENKPSRLIVVGDNGIFTNPPIANINLYSNKSNADELGRKLSVSTSGNVITVTVEGGNNNA
jgi:hypothetical protein